MEAGKNGTAHGACVRYKEFDWGDVIEGTKDQLQALGLAIGRAFPGEVGGPRSELKVRDPRGFPVSICRRDGDYIAYLKFPNWPALPSREKWVDFADGVKLRESFWFDEYRGSAEALAQAGLVRVDQLPGKPGMRKVRVRLLPDGSLSSGARNANICEGRLPGARWIQRASTSTYQVGVVVPEQEERRRRVADAVAWEEWRSCVKALKRPARLQSIPVIEREAAQRAQTGAARDVAFQWFLARVVSNTSPRDGRSR